MNGHTLCWVQGFRTTQPAERHRADIAYPRLIGSLLAPVSAAYITTTSWNPWRREFLRSTTTLATTCREQRSPKNQRLHRWPCARSHRTENESAMIEVMLHQLITVLYIPRRRRHSATAGKITKSQIYRHTTSMRTTSSVRTGFSFAQLPDDVVWVAIDLSVRSVQSSEAVFLL